MMLCTPFTLAPNTAACADVREAFALYPQSPVALDAQWPDAPMALVQVDDSNTVDNGWWEQAHAWVDACPQGIKVQVALRSIHILCKGSRAVVLAGADAREAAAQAVWDFVRLMAVVEQHATALDALQHQLRSWQATVPADIEPVRGALGRSTALGLERVQLQTWCDLPAWAAPSDLAARLRTEMLTQTQCSERLSLLEQRWEIVHNGLGDVLDRTQEARRWRLEHRIGWAIVVLILLDLTLSLWTLWHDL